jgi:uncharacterized membrane protein
MTNLLRFLYLLSLVVWVGGIIFFSFVGAPSTFQAVPTDVAGKVVSKIFPRYYLLGHMAGLIALASGVGLAGLRGDVSFRRLLPTILIALMLAIGLYADRGVRTQIDGVRAATAAAAPSGAPDASLKARFDRLHRLSVVLNGVVLCLGLAVLFITATELQL